ncbi:MAG: HEAT repeat domain-containing protein [Phycisphaerae bacterium]
MLAMLTGVALAVSGCGRPSDAACAGALLEAAASGRGRERVEATEAVLDLAERLAAAGDTATAERIYRTLWDVSAAPDRRHVRCAAIRGLARLLGPAAVEDLAAAMAGEDEQVAAAAFAAAAWTGGADVTRAWAAYLPTAPAAVRPQVIRVLGRRGGRAAIDAVLAALKSEDDAVRRVAIEAAGRLTTPHAVGPLVRLLDAEDADARVAAETALSCLSAPGASEAVAERLSATLTRGGSEPVPSEAEGHPPRLHADVPRPASSGRAPDGAAARRGKTRRGTQAAPVGSAVGREAPAPEFAASLIRVLAARAARDQADAVAACLADGPREVQTAALEALAVLGGERHVPAILAALVQAKHGEVRRSAETALAAIGARASRGGSKPGPSDAEGHRPRAEITEASSAAGTETRRASDGARRFVAQVGGAMEMAGPEARCTVLRVLGAVPTARGLSAVRQAMRDEEEAVRLSAVRVASDWPTAAPAPDLLAVAHEAESAKARILALRGVVRLAGRVADPAARTRLLGRALAAAERVQEKRLALAALGEVASPEALAVALAHLEDASLAGEAAAAVVGVAEGIADAHPAETKAALEAVLEATEAPRVRERAGRLLGRIGG